MVRAGQGLRVGMDEGFFLGLWGDVLQTGPLQTTKHAKLPTGALSAAGPAPAAATRSQLHSAGAFGGGGVRRPCYAQEVVVLPNSQREEKPTIQVPVPQGCLVSPQS